MNGLTQMLNELESSQLQVVLVPSKRHDARSWDCIRCAISKNATWYRKFCSRHSSNRRRKNSAHDTKIKRANVLSALAGLISGRYNGKYAQELINIASHIK